MSGKWAVITGASSGIGKALALEFAAHRFNILLIARNQKALAEVAEECSHRNGAETEVIATDLSDPGSLDRLYADLASHDRHYEVLVNNAGFGIHGDFASTNLQQNLQLVNVQVAAAIAL